MRLRIPLTRLLSLRAYQIIAQHIFHREELLRCYLENTKYSADDYTRSEIDNYVPFPRYYSCCSRMMQRDDLHHSAYSHLFLPLKNLYNARDWFGWGLGKPHISPRLGQIFRGSCLDNLSSEEIEYLKHRVKIGAELDLRGNEKALPGSILGTDVIYRNIKLHPYLYGVKHQSEGYRSAFRFMLSTLQTSCNIYVHCTGGADRTGCFFFLLGAALGFSESDLCKDYELTSFSCYGIRKRCFSSTNSSFPFREMVQYIKNFGRGSFQENALSWWAQSNEKEPGITDFEWELLRKALV